MSSVTTIHHGVRYSVEYEYARHGALASIEIDAFGAARGPADHANDVSALINLALAGGIPVHVIRDAVGSGSLAAVALELAGFGPAERGRT